MAGARATAAQPALFDELPKVRVPVLLQWCGYDTVISQGAAPTVARFKNTTVTLIEYPDVGHFPMWEIPERFSEYADVSQADYGKFSATRQGDLNIIKIGQERYEIPDALPFGG